MWRGWSPLFYVPFHLKIVSNCCTCSSFLPQSLKLSLTYLEMTLLKLFHHLCCPVVAPWTLWHKSNADEMKEFIRPKWRQSVEDARGEGLGLCSASISQLCPQDADIKHLAQNVGGGRKVFVWDSQILMASRRGNLLLRSKSKVQRNAKTFISLVVFLPAKSGRNGLLLFGQKGPRGRMNSGAINIFSSCAKDSDQQEIFLVGYYRICLSLLLPTTTCLYFCFPQELWFTTDKSFCLHWNL